MEEQCYVTVLEHYLRSINLNSNYELMPPDSNAKNRMFKFNLTVNDKIVTGVGRTKRKAKEQAAETMYNALIDAEKGKVCDKSEESEDPIQGLEKFCIRHSLGSPIYAFETYIISPRGDMYTVSCTVLGLREQARGFRKDRAKKHAAQLMLTRLKEQEQVHEIYIRAKENEVKNNVSFILPDGSVNEEAEHKLIADVRRRQFAEYLTRSETASEMKSKEESYLDEVEDPEGLFNRILKEMDVAHSISFEREDQEWVCIIQIFPLHYAVRMKHHNKTVAGKAAIKKVLMHMHSL